MNAFRKLAEEEAKEQTASEADESEGVDHLANTLSTDLKMAHAYSELNAYLRPLLRYPTLTKDEQYSILFDRYKNGNPKERMRARDVIVYGNTRLVLKIGWRHCYRGLPLLDLLQEGMIGCMRAVEKFEIKQGCRFSTYATPWIRQGMTRAIHDKGEQEPYRTPVHEAERILFVRRLYTELCLEKARPPKELEVFQRAKTLKTKIAEKLTLSDVVRITRGMFTGKAVRLDAPINQHEGEGDESVIDRLNTGRPRTETVVDARQLYIQYQLAAQRIESAVSELPPRTAMVIRLRFGLGEFDAMTLEQVAERYELTRERIRQIEETGLEALHSTLGLTGQQIEEIVDVMQDLEVIANAV